MWPESLGLAGGVSGSGRSKLTAGSPLLGGRGLRRVEEWCG
ncbi:hypothetical protein LINGRAHAP2_LOCUS19339 [Linum grandiflorum]